MTKKDYQAIAGAIYRAIHHQKDPRMAGAMREVSANIAEVLQRDNPRFDSERFFQACENGKCRGMRQVA